MSTLSERWGSSSRAFRVLLLLLAILLALLCLFVILQYLLPILLQPKVGFSSADYSVDESLATTTITVTLSAESRRTVTVNYATSDGTAEADKDYTAASGTLTFDPGSTSQTFSVAIIDDEQDENDESVNLTLSSPSNAKLGRKDATLTIIDDDVPLPKVNFSNTTYEVREDVQTGTATITVTLNMTSNLTITVDYATSDDTAEAGVDYTATSGTLTFSPGDTSQNFTVPILDDELEEDKETVTLTLSDPSNASLGGTNPATLNIIDDEGPVVDFSSSTYSVAEDAGSATITVTLTPTSENVVTVDYETVEGTATAGEDYTTTSGSLTFNPGDSSKTFTVAILEDEVEEGNETVTLNLAHASNANIGSNNPATLTILDSGPDQMTVGFSSTTYTVPEDAGTAAITVTLNTTSEQPVTVDYGTSDNTAVAGSDYTTTSGTLTFTPGVVIQTFTVPITDDTQYEGDETVTLTLENASSDTAIKPNQATLTIRDNDPTTCTVRNLLRNGDFEGGFQPSELGKEWNSFNNGNAAFSFHIDDWPLVVVEGEHTQLIEIKEAVKSDRYLGIYQTAEVIPGEVYTFSIRGLVRTNIGDVEKTSYGYRLEVGFDLDGGQDWEAIEKEDWTELMWDEQLRIQDSFRFDAYTTTLTADSDELTVFVRAWKKWADVGEGDYDVDDIRLVGLVCETPPIPGIPVTGEAPLTIWDNVRVWATIALLLLLFGGAIWKFGLKRT